MKYVVDENWWMSVFDEVYLQTDARTVEDQQLTCQEIDFLECNLPIQPTQRILDLCGGQGRHALELARRGYLYITVFDYSRYLLPIGKKQADSEKLTVWFVRGDARCIGMRDSICDFIMLMGSSFGYFVREEENQKILSESLRLLVSGGIVLLDLPDRNHVTNHFKVHSRHRANDRIEVIRDRKLEADIIYCREKVLDVDGRMIREEFYCTRLYSRSRIRELLFQTGFQDVCFENDFMCRQKQGDYGCMTNRMLVMAKKP